MTRWEERAKKAEAEIIDLKKEIDRLKKHIRRMAEIRDPGQGVF